MPYYISDKEPDCAGWATVKKEADGYSNADLPPLDPTLDPWGYGPLHKRPESVLIIDESSMIDLHLAWRILRALTLHCRIVFVGDIAQLPPIGAGFIFKELIESRRYTRKPEKDKKRH